MSDSHESCRLKASRRELHVSVTDGRGRTRRDGGLAGWLCQVAPSSATGLVVVALVCDRKMRDLNRQFRTLDRVTDVLSFSAGSVGEHLSLERSSFLGDIVIARRKASRQARVNGLTEQQEWRRLALHGLLHLLGYDHECDDGEMRRLERRLQKRGGLPV